MNAAGKILEQFATPSLFVTRQFCCGKMSGTMIYHPDITDSEAILYNLTALTQTECNAENLDVIVKTVLVSGEVEILDDLSTVPSRILNGDAAVFFDGTDGVILINARKWDKRSIAEPPTDLVVKGPREGFIEDLKTNLSLIERRLKSPSLAVQKLVIGRQGNVNVAVLYLENIVKKSIVDEVIKRLKEIDIDSVFDAYTVEPFLDAKPYSVFRQCGVTERPDAAAAKMLEGRVAVIIDGSPMVLTVPYLFVEDFYSSEDYYQRSNYATFIRFLRFFSIVFALFLPALIVAVQMYNFNILPLRLLITIMDAVRGTPLSPLNEMLFVLLLFELIREASVRMPRPVGTAMSIVGALVLGDTAVKAGILSSPTILFAALSSIALYTAPHHIESFSLLRLGLTLAGGLLGLYGIVLMSVAVIHYLAGINSYETPYLAPLAPLIPPDLKDNAAKRSILDLKKRPKSIPNTNETRQK